MRPLSVVNGNGKKAATTRTKIAPLRARLMGVATTTPNNTTKTNDNCTSFSGLLGFGKSPTEKIKLAIGRYWFVWEWDVLALEWRMEGRAVAGLRGCDDHKRLSGRLRLRERRDDGLM